VPHLVPVRIHWALPWGATMALAERDLREQGGLWTTGGSPLRLRAMLCMQAAFTAPVDTVAPEARRGLPVCEVCLDAVQQRVLVAVETRTRRLIHEVRAGVRQPEEVGQLLDEEERSRSDAPPPMTPRSMWSTGAALML
jgi:hypothetical protein